MSLSVEDEMLASDAFELQIFLRFKFDLAGVVTVRVLMTIHINKVDK